MHVLRFVLPLVLAVSCGGDGDGGAAGHGRTNALLITLDTTRPEAYGAFGAHPGLTPHLDRIAREGVIYTEARTTSPLTTPAHASILTGLYPPRHSVRINGTMVLPDEADTLAELAQARGYDTAAFVAVVVLADTYGVGQGFAHFDAPAAPDVMLERTYESRPAGEVVDAALAWYAARDRSKPFFVWLHVYDAHAPYDPPAEFLAQAGGDPYLGEAAWADAELGRFLDALRADGAYDDTAIAVVSDHGEGLGEHGEATHGFFCFESTMRVPLVLRLPEGAPGAAPGTRSDVVASVVDILPTFAEALGLPLASAIDGTSLLGPIPADRGVYFESFFGAHSLGGSPLAGWATRDAKYLHSSRPVFFDLAADPGETRDLLAERAEDAARFRAEIGRVADLPALAPVSTEALTAEMMAALEGLGYTGAGHATAGFPHPLAPSDRPSPLDRVAAYAEFQRALDLNALGRAADALPIFERLVRENPLNSSAAFQLGGCLVQLGRHADAIPHLEANLRLRGSWRGPHILLGVCYEALGRPADAVREYRIALEHDAGLDRIADSLIRLLDELGRTDEANVLRLERRWMSEAAGG